MINTILNSFTGERGMIFTVFRWFFREFAQNPVFGPGALGRNPEDSGVLVRLQSARGSARMEETFVKQKEGGPVDFLLNYVTFAIAAVLFVGVAVVLIARWFALPVLVKISLCTVLLALVLYFAFVIYAVLLAGSAVPPHAPQPIPA